MDEILNMLRESLVNALGGLMAAAGLTVLGALSARLLWAYGKRKQAIPTSSPSPHPDPERPALPARATPTARLENPSAMFPSQLETYLHEQDARLWRTLGNVRQAAEEIWKTPLHSYYTDHTVTHSERVIEKLDALTAGIMRRLDQRLSPLEVYVLLAAAYLHDIGMQDQRFAHGNLEKIRAQHHEHSAEMIRGSVRDPAKYRPLGLDPDPTLVHLVALVAEAHRRVDLSTSRYDPVQYEGHEIRPRLLGALLRFADELDIDHRRVILENLKILLADMPTYFYWYKCYYVSGVAIRDEYIKIQYRFPEADYDEVIRPLVEDEIRGKFQAIQDILRDGGVRANIGTSAKSIIEMDKMPADVLAYACEQRVRKTLAEIRRMMDDVEQLLPHSKPFYLADATIEQTKAQVALLSNRAMQKRPVLEFPAQEIREVQAINELVYDIFSATVVGFVNRRDELQSLIRSTSPDFILVTAPAGFGKSYLLRAVEEFFREPQTSDWIVLPGSLAQQGTVETIIQDLLDQLGPVAESCSSASDRLAAALNSACGGQPRKIGGILLLDGIEWLPAEAATSLRQVLQETNERLWGMGLRLRAILATRCLSREWEGWGYEFPLMPFTTLVVEEAILTVHKRKQLTPPAKEDCHRLAGEVRWVSGGHPQGMVHILDDLSQREFRATVDEEVRRRWFQDYIRPLVPALLHDVPEELHDAFRTLSAFRWFTAEVLNVLLTSEPIGDFPSGDMLLRQMAAAHLIRPPQKLGDPGYTDEIVRAVLLAQMFFETPARFRALNELAWQIHDRWLQDQDANGRPLRRPRGLPEQLHSLQEALYHSLCLQRDHQALMEQLDLYLALLQEHFGSEARQGAQRLLAALQKDEESRWAARQSSEDVFDVLLGAIQQFAQGGGQDV